MLGFLEAKVSDVPVQIDGYVVRVSGKVTAYPVHTIEFRFLVAF